MNEAETQPQVTATSFTSPLPAVQSGSIIESARDAAKLEADRVTKEVLEHNLPRYTEVLAVFVALFTFVSIQVQLFSRVTSLSNAILFIFLIFLCMIGFLFTLHFIINMKGDSFKDNRWSVIGLISILIFGFIVIFYLDKKNIPLSVQEDTTVKELKARIDNQDKIIENLKGSLLQ